MNKPDDTQTTPGTCPAEHGGKREDCAAWPACACEPTQTTAQMISNLRVALNVEMTAEAEREIARLHGIIAGLEQRLEDQYRQFEMEVRYFHRRVGPVHFSIHRDNYEEIIQVFHPLDEQRIRELVMK